jgi:hypothetical protein
MIPLPEMMGRAVALMNVEGSAAGTRERERVREG